MTQADKFKESPLVSIVMPVYNTGIFLKDAIGDIIKQNYENIELICIDDGSSDQSPLVLDFFEETDNRIKVIKQKNRGAGVARNIGLGIATGEYIMFLDSDDRFEPTLVESSIRRALDTAADIVVVGAEEFDSNTNLIISSSFGDWLIKERLLPNKVCFSHADCNNYIFQAMTLLPWNKLFNMGFLRDNHVQFNDIPYYNDSFFVSVNMAEAKRITVINEKQVYYRSGRDSSITRSESKSKHPEYAFDLGVSIKNELIKRGLYEKVWKSLALYCSEVIDSHIRFIDDDNYEVFEKALDRNFLETVRIDRLKKDDFLTEEEAENMDVLLNRGFDKYLARMTSKIAKEAALLINNCAYIANGEAQCFTDKYFDIGRIPTGSRVVLWGAGARGKRIYRDISITKKYRLVMWVDSLKDKTIDGVIIHSPDDICFEMFDYLIIAIDDVISVRNVRQLLLNRGIDKQRIIW